METWRLANALSALGEGMGNIAEMKQKKEQFDAQNELEDRRQRANQQFEATLTMMRDKAQADREDAREKAQGDRQDKEFGQQMTMEQQRSAQQDKMQAATLGSENAFHSAELGMEGERLGMEKDKATTDKYATVINSRLNSIDRTIANYQNMADRKKAALEKDPNYMGMTTEQQQAATDAIDKQYAPMIQQQTQIRDAYSQKLSKLTGVDTSDVDKTAGMGGGQPSSPGLSQQPNSSDGSGVPTNPGNGNANGMVAQPGSGLTAQGDYMPSYPLGSGMPPAPPGTGVQPSPAGAMPPNPQQAGQAGQPGNSAQDYSKLWSQ